MNLLGRCCKQVLRIAAQKGIDNAVMLRNLLHSVRALASIICLLCPQMR